MCVLRADLYGKAGFYNEIVQIRGKYHAKEKLIAALLVLAGCGSSGGNEPVKPDDAGNKPAKEEKVTVEETVLLDEGGIKITATGFDEKGFWGPELKLLLENNTENNIIVSTDALIVNNYMVSDLFSDHENRTDRN